ncbi:MBG domain-containing protein [Novipirellula galeiformis]|uniref:MBG domain-containing protein n=1 Tax=Novipirellula galeiformis TaxID=2528004 RepID=UPI0018CE5E0B|nr:MBG domain-containing protein [Novipirellula galeiformis]
MALCLLIVFQPCAAPLVRAQNPTGGTVVAGAATISTSGSTLNVNSTTDRAIINWQGFNIGAGNTTNFNQPGANSAVLNRVTTPGSPSSIYGNLNSNGNVYLVNPSGVLVGPSGVITTNGFTASTFDIGNREFMNGGPLNFSGSSNASVINQGTINTGSGGAHLIGNEVYNQGIINSLGGSVRLSNGATYVQADNATIQNGVSEYASVIGNSGTVRATGALMSGGDVYLTAPGGRVMNSGTIHASSGSQTPADPQVIQSTAPSASSGGNVYLNGSSVQHSGQITASSPGGGAVVMHGTQQATVSGSVVATNTSPQTESSSAGTRVAGPQVTITGDSVELSNATIDASAIGGGGSVNIGGGYQGNNSSIANSQSTTVDAASVIQANAIDFGDGGTVVLWSDGNTDFHGTISARGVPLGSGGLVEVSGKQQLNFAGSVDTGGGHLLLDPFNYVIGAAQATNIINALTSNHVTIQTSVDDTNFGSSGNNTDFGDITVNSNILYDSSYDLTFLAHRNIHFNASVQNRNATGGDINIVAGWNGTTAFNASTFEAVDVNAAATFFGNNAGSIFIGDGTQTTGIAVGSRSGTTRAFAHDVALQGSNGTDRAFAQLGFQISNGIALGGFDLDPTIDNGSNVTVNGGITIHTTQNLSAIGGNLALAYAQVGHVGTDLNGGSKVEAAADAIIEIAVGGDIQFTGGNGTASYAQLGQGGYRAYGDHSGTTTITNTGDIHFTGGGSSTSYVQLGQGGYFARGDHSGTTTITNSGDINFTSSNSYAQLGQGGYNANGNHSGITTITNMGYINFRGGYDASYAQLGQGGYNADGDHSGTTTITNALDINFKAGSGLYSYAQLGQGGYKADGNHSGTTTITNALDINFKAGSSHYSYAQLGQGGNRAYGDHSGTTTITNARDINFQGGNGYDHTYAQLGQGGYEAYGDHSGSITITNARDINFKAGSGEAAYAQLGQGGYNADGNHSGTTTITDARDIQFMGDREAAYAQLGQGGHEAEGNHSGTTTITATGDIHFTGGSEFSAYAQLGQGGYYAHGSHSGTTTITATGDIQFTGGRESYAYAQLGQGGYGAIGDHSGTTLITATGNIQFTGGSGYFTYAQLGQGGTFAHGDHSGTTTITNAGDIQFTGGAGAYAYAQLGQGGYTAVGDHSGTIDVTIDGNLTLTGQDLTGRYALIGHGDQPNDSDVNQTVSGDIMLRIGGSANLTNAVIGHRIDADGLYSDTDPDGNVIGADTFLGVRGDITTDTNSQLFSGGVGTGELRLYVGGNDNVDSTALLNGIAHGSNVFPNDQGMHVFGTGPYAVGGGSNAVASGNFNYYHINPDLFNYTVNATEASAIASTLDGGTAVTLERSLNQANFGAHYDWDGGTQFIDINSDLLYDSTAALTLLATGDVNFNAAVQNRSGDGGDLNIVAGWDGTTPFNAATFAAIDVNAVPTLFGLDGGAESTGSIFIGDGTQTTGIAVGSRSGTTRAFAHDVALQGSNGTDRAFAQLGFQISNGIAWGGFDLDPTLDNGSNVTVNGGISIHTTQNLSATGGNRTYAYAQIGHVGANFTGDTKVEAAAEAVIVINNAGDIHFTGGYDLAYAQLGQGGYGAHGDHGGTTTIINAGDIHFTGGDFAAYAQLGQGGYSADGNHNGTTTITNTGDINFEGGSDYYAYAQLGQGGPGVKGNHSGTTTITNAGDINFTGGNYGAYAQLGQGGYYADGNHSGTTTITNARNIHFTGGAGGSAYAQLGQGGYRAAGNHSGTTTITNTGDIHFKGGTGEASYAQLGQGGAFAAGDHSGTTTVTNTGDIHFRGGSGEAAYAQLGQGGYYANGNHSGTTTITNTGDINFTGGNYYAYAQLGQGGYSASGDHSGTTTITNTGDINFTGGNGEAAYAQLGQGGYYAYGDHRGMTTITNARDTNFTGGTGDATYAQLGQGGYAATGNHSGTTTITNARDIHFTGGGGFAAYTQLGQGGFNARGNHSGTIDVTIDGNLTLTGQDLTGRYALIGHGDQPNDSDVNQTVSGDIMLRIGGSANLTNAVIGHRIDADGMYSDTDPDGNVIGADTFLGVRGDITTDTNSQLFSGGVGTGELRLYVGGNDNVDSTALLNGIAHGSNVFPNDQGMHVFGTGPYAVGGGSNAVASGNFNYYHINPDLFNYTVNATEASAIAATLDGGTAVTLERSLNQANFGAHYDWDGGTQFIDINSDLLYDSTAALTLLATGDVNFNAAVQNRSGDGGDLNIVAGWDGTTPFNAATFAAIDVNAVPTLFGLDGGAESTGSIFIGDGTQTTGIAVGSRSGATNVFANNLNITGSDAAHFAFAQLGFRATDQGDTFAITGGLNARTTGGIRALAGSKQYAYAQLGHVGADLSSNGTVDATVDAAITIAAGGDLTFTAGDGDFASSQLGHGGAYALSKNRGDITLTHADNLTFNGGNGEYAYSQLGHGGRSAASFYQLGDILITAADDIEFSSGAGSDAYSQLGHGGVLADGNRTGSIDITASGNLTLQGKVGGNRYAVIGHGDELGDSDTGESANGAIKLRIGGSANLTAGFIGHTIESHENYFLGSTSIAIGLNNYVPSNTTDTLTADADSQFFSGPGELRFYLPNRDAFAVNDGAKLNGVLRSVAAGSIPFHNEVGAFAPFEGGYLGSYLGTNPDNYSFYFSAQQIIEIFVNALGGSSTYGTAPVDPGMELVSGTLRMGDTLDSIGLTTNFNLTRTSAANTYTLRVDDSNLDSLYVLTGTTDSTFTINPAALTITANDLTKTFGDAFGFVGDEFSSSGLQNDETIDLVTLASAGAPAAADAGSYGITASAPTGGGTFDAANYDITFNDGTFTVDKAALSIVALAQTKTYGSSALDPTAFQASGLQNGNTVAQVSFDSTGQPATASVGSYEIVADGIVQSGNGFKATNYDIAFTSLANGLTINPAALTITANDLTKTFGDAFGFVGNEFAASGLQNGETIDLVTLASAGALGTADAGSYGITASAPTGGGTFDATNYDITFNDGTFTVDKAALSIAALAQGKTYGSSTLDPTAFQASGLQNGNTVSQVSFDSIGQPATAGVGSYDIVADGIVQSGNGFKATNYDVTFVPLTNGLTINPAALTITANDQTKTFGDAFGFVGDEFTSSGLQNGETIDGVTLASAGAPATADAGSYGITASAPTGGGTFDATNYDITFNDGTFTVDKAALSIAALAQGKTYGSNVLDPTAFQASGLQNGNSISQVSFDSTGQPATASVGSYDIVADGIVQSGNGFKATNYDIAFTSLANGLTINPAALTITANDLTKTFGDAFGFVGDEFSSSGLQNGETIDLVTLASAGAPAAADAGSYGITASAPTGGGTFDATNYDITFNDGTFTVDKAALSIAALAQGKTYGSSTLDPTAFEVFGLQNGNTVSQVSFDTAGQPATASVGSYDIVADGIVLSGNGFKATNYDIAFTSLANGLTINPAALTITANDLTKTFGDAFGFVGDEFSSNGLQNGETIDAVTLASAGAPATADAGSYGITASNPTSGGTFDAANYDITFNDGTFTVGKAALSIAALAQGKTYGSSTLDPTAFEAFGLQNGNSVSQVSFDTAGQPATASVGSYDIVADGIVQSGNGFKATNYDIAFTSLANGLTINPAALTITANDQTKTFGDAFGFVGDEFSSSGLQNGETIDLVTLASAGAPATADAGSYGITASAPTGGGTFDATNYDITFNDGTFTVDKAALSIAALAQGKTYGSSVLDSTAFQASGLQNGNTVSQVSFDTTGQPATASVGSYDIVADGILQSGNGFKATNYDIAFTSLANGLTINPAALTITANDLTKTFGDAFGFVGDEFSSSGLQNGETIDLVTLASAGAPAAADAGSYGITASAPTGGGTFDATNYDITFNDGTFTVDKAALSIAALAQGKTYGSNVLDPTAFQASGLQNGNSISQVSFDSTGQPATASVGSYDIVADGIVQSGNGFKATNYDIAFTSLANGLTINPAALTITANDQTKTFGDAFGFVGNEFAASGLQNGETIDAVTLASAGAPAAADAGSYGITASAPTGGGTFDAANYDITFNDGTFTVGKAALMITALNQFKPVGNSITLDPSAISTAGLMNHDTIDGVTLASPGSIHDAPLGVYEITPSDPFGNFDADNYNITLVEGKLIVSGIGSGQYAYDQFIRYDDYNRSIESLIPSVQQGAITFSYPLIGGQPPIESEAGENLSDGVEDTEGANDAGDLEISEVFIQQEIRVRSQD